MNTPVPALQAELAALAGHLARRREAILAAWRRAVMKDPELTTAESLPRVQLNDHIPLLLQIYERRLDPSLENQATRGACDPDDAAAAHGLHRWQQGYDLRELSQELGRLNECVVVELEAYAGSHPDLRHEVMATARWMWAELIAHESSASIAEYFRLQQLEAAGHMKDLERALGEIRELERQRAHLWHEAAHDLRGNLGVVVSATAGLVKAPAGDSGQAAFIRVLDRNVKSLRHLLDEVTDLARLQAGRERLQRGSVDVAALMIELCGDLREQAVARGLFLRCDGAPAYVVEGDAIKIRRIAQNLILNAIKYTQRGGIHVQWSESSAPDDDKRWVLSVQDSGPGFDAGPGSPLVAALGEGTDLGHQSDADSSAQARTGAAAAAPVPSALPEAGPSPHQEAGEGIGLSIVKRLSELLRASVEVESENGRGTTFRVFFPKRYSAS
ncbi:MAG: HAMP domain-containing sensor histidine kinase [Rhizobacter sp.]